MLVITKPSLMQIMQCHAYPRRKTNDAGSTPSAKVVMHRRRVSISSRAGASFLNTMTRRILMPLCISPARASPLSGIVFGKLCLLCSVLCSVYSRSRSFFTSLPQLLCEESLRGLFNSSSPQTTSCSNSYHSPPPTVSAHSTPPTF